VSYLKRLVARLLRELEKDFTTFRTQFNRAFRPKRPFEVVPYLGFGTPTRFFLKGRVIEDKGPLLETPDATRWRNFVNTYKRFVSNKVPHARLLVRYPGGERELQADAKGYFEAAFELQRPVAEGWCEVFYTLLEPQRKGVPPATATGSVLIPGRGAQFGVISDMDDTVVQTDVTRWLRVLSTVLFGNAYTRLPFGGVSAFYRALQRGTQGVSNPLFYVSSSPWNLYDLLLAFLKIEKIPVGPLLLRDWRGGGGEFFPAEHNAFKRGEVRRILETFPELPFILIGDSGEEDPEIYGEIVRAFPGRILAVYIRNVSGEARSAALSELGRRVQEMGSTLVLADDTLAAAKHAAQRGWIAEAALAEVRAGKERDRSPFEAEAETEATVIEGVMDGDAPRAQTERV